MKSDLIPTSDPKTIWNRLSSPDVCMLIGDGFSFAMEIAHETAKLKGFWDTPRELISMDPRVERYVTAAQMMNVVSEVAECNEWMRKNPTSESKTIPGYTDAVEEMADCVIRIMDLCAANGWDLGGAVVAKMQYNMDREHMNGGKGY